MRIYPTLFVVVACLGWNVISAQTSAPCGTDRLRQVAGPEALISEAGMDQTIRSVLANRGGGTPILTVPVVVHIVHDGGNENISDAQVLQGLDHLNDAFANAGPYFHADGVNIPIRFCLANTDPLQQPSTGITRTQSALTVLEFETQDFQLKSLVNWPSVSYLNIWVVRAINSAGNNPAVAGYATLPSSHGSQTDGVVVESQWFGTSPEQTIVLVHEAGHYLGLYHTFEGGCGNTNCAEDGDQVCDTPPDQSIAPVCMPTANSCTSDSDDPTAQNPFRATTLGGLGDVPDQFQNYMDYGLYSCMDRLTAGQGERMYAALTSIRSSLLDANVCAPPCGVNSVIGIVPPSTTVAIGQATSFGNASGSLSPHTFAWYVDGVFAGSTTDLDWTFTNSGEHSVELRMLITDETCFLSEEIMIEVGCDAQAAFTYSPMPPDVNESTVFTSTEPGGSGFQWLINGAVAGAGSPFITSFPEAGGYSVALVVNGIGCTDTSAVAFVPVGECTSGRNNTWVLAGRDIVNFNSGAPVSQVQGAAAAFGAYEGLASISDDYGNLVLYCDAHTVFNGDHEPIAGGMNGGTSSSQAALILPHPGNAQQYYVITTDDAGGANGGGMQYTLIDMSLNGGGGGAVATNAPMMPQTSEKLTAAVLCDGSGYWVIGQTRIGDAYHVFKLDANGLNTTPVISPEVGLSWPALGCLRASPKGDHIAGAYYQGGVGVRLRRFDNASGVVSGFIDLNTTGIGGVYGVEFSADGSKLYATNLDEQTYSTNFIRQWDLSSNIPQVVMNSEGVAASATHAGPMGSLQRGPDGRIYVLRDGVPWLDAINTPNEPGAACGYEEYAVHLNRNTFGYGISNHAPLLSDAAPVIHGPTTVCSGTENVAYTLSCTVAPPTWSHSGPNELVSSSASSAVLSFTEAGTDTLVAIFNADCNGQSSDTLFITTGSPTVPLGNDTLVCAPPNLQLDAGAGAYNYQWQDGSIGRYFHVSSAGTYTATVYGLGGCSTTDDITISTFDGPWSFSLGPDIVQCPNVGIYVSAPAGQYSAYEWSNGSTQDSAILNPGGSLALTLYDALGCAASDTIQSIVATAIDPTISGDTTICPGQVVVLSTNSVQPSQYYWNDGTNSSSLTIYNPGVYWVQVYGCGWNGQTDSITISAAPAPLIELGPDTILCPWQPVQLTSDHPAETYFWSNGTTANTLLAEVAGTYWLTVMDGNGCYATDSITVSFCTGSAPSLGASIILMPNPNDGNMVLQLPAGWTDTTASIFDTRGKLVRQLSGLRSGSNAIDLHDLATGLYTLSLMANAMDQGIRFSIQGK